jgi:hypothetical protein
MHSTQLSVCCGASAVYVRRQSWHGSKVQSVVLFLDSQVYIQCQHASKRVGLICQRVDVQHRRVTDQVVCIRDLSKALVSLGCIPQTLVLYHGNRRQHLRCEHPGDEACAVPSFRQIHKLNDAIGTLWHMPPIHGTPVCAQRILRVPPTAVRCRPKRHDTAIGPCHIQGA